MLVLLWFVECMNRKLVANQHKRHWLSSEVTLGYLRVRLHQEVRELMRELDKCKGNGEVGRAAVDAIANEAADVANFAMMIASKAQHLREIGWL